MEMSELVQEFLNHKKLWSFEGDSGVENLNTLVEALGYRPHGFKYGTSLEVFLSDNPGCQQAIIEWIEQQNIQEWAENLESELPEKTEETEEDEQE